MHVLCINLLLSAFMVMASAQSNCDPSTQFEVNGQCCRKCPPGTKMTTFSSCQNPDCKECEENQYMEGYTTEQKCEQQPHCDPNKKFQTAVHQSKEERTVCQCQLGFHCSSQSCFNCVPHTQCGPGQWAAIKGSHSQDTRCERCPNGTFSTETSWNGDCKKWTKCESGYQVVQAGTHTSDNICDPSRAHVITAVIISLIAIAVICGVLFCCVRTGRTGHLKVNNCVESYQREELNPKKDGVMLLAQPTAHVEDEPTFTDALPSQEESREPPEENDDESGLEISSDVALTDNGNFVTQEDGKKEVLSRQESQTQTGSVHTCNC